MLEDNVQQDTKPEAGFRAGPINTDSKTETTQSEPEIEKPIQETEQSQPETVQEGINSADQAREGSDYPTDVADPKSPEQSSSEDDQPMLYDNPDSDPNNPEPDKTYTIFI